MGRRHDTVSFLSDLGTADELAGVVRAVIRDLAPHAHVLDLTHGIDPHDVRSGSLALVRAVSYVPAGVVLAVVDPGVGTDRRAVAIEVQGGAGVFVGPDNGLLAPAVALAGGAERAVELTAEPYRLPAPGVTFAARDVFAPAAAHLCNGVDLLEFGPEVDVHTLLPAVVPLPREEGEELVAEVLWVDRYGNVQLNVGPDDLDGRGERCSLRFGDTTRTAVRAGTFGAVRPGEIGLVVDGSGLMAVVLDRNSAAAELGLRVGDEVRLAGLGDDERSVPVPVRIRFDR